MSKNITFSIDGKPVIAKEGTTVLEAALDNGIYLPHLCHHPDLSSSRCLSACVVLKSVAV